MVGKRLAVRTATGTACIHVSPEGIRVILSLVEGRPYSGTVTVLGRAPGTTYRPLTGILGSTVTGTRGGGGVSASELCMDCYGIATNPALGEVHPETRNETCEVGGEASRVAVAIGRARSWTEEGIR